MQTDAKFYLMKAQRDFAPVRKQARYYHNSELGRFLDILEADLVLAMDELMAEHRILNRPLGHVAKPGELKGQIS